MEAKYEHLKSEYPEHISLDQLYRVCRISKRSALYLVKHEIIPVIDTGKQTWRYKIAIDDVIAYLHQRDKYGSMIPPGATSSRPPNRMGSRKSFAQIVSQGREWEVAEYFNYVYADCGDVLTREDIEEMTGLEKSTVLKMLKAGHIKSVMVRPKYLIPKQYLLEFVVTR
jgi:excisionase family DNA binding protein